MDHLASFVPYSGCSTDSNLVLAGRDVGKYQIAVFNWMKSSSLIIAVVLSVMTFGITERVSGQQTRGGFFNELFAPIEHSHFSDLGTPYVHPFNFEPAQIHQDVFFIYRQTQNNFEGADEFESEAHLDWALTKRLGFVLGAAHLGVQNGSGIHSAGIGDLEIAPRVMLVERDKFILTSNFFITAPTGDAARDLGAGETVLSPYITTWHDLGNWNTLSVNFGPDIATNSGDVSLSYAFSLTHSWIGPQLLGDESHGEENEEAEEGGNQHFEPGMTSLYLEMTGETPLSGGAPTFIELMPGISYVLTEHGEIRFGVLAPVSDKQRFDVQYFSSFTWIY